ncbi:hypothetical protein GQ53DRAFT_861867 [Thozetella sp. PMI_491]|nr:hypothetical protein GQ53DRAFT_861867 [Thozetella sp. PMI_491]
MAATDDDDGVIDTTKTYILMTRFTGPSMVLAVSDSGDKDGPSLTMMKASDARDKGQWFLTRVNGDQPGIFYRMHVASMGLPQSMDVINEGGAVNSSRLTMAASGSNSGQAWRFDRWSDKDSDGYRLSNKMSGLDVHLDILAGSKDPYLSGGDSLGQHWVMTSAATRRLQTDDSQDIRSSASGSQPLLSRDGAIALGVVGGLGLSLLLLSGVYWLGRYRSRRKRTRAAPAELSGEGAEKKVSFESFHSDPKLGLHPLQTVTSEPGPDVDSVSPASTYSQASLVPARLSTGPFTKAPKDGSPVLGSIPVAELPDQRY